MRPSHRRDEVAEVDARRVAGSEGAAFLRADTEQAVRPVAPSPVPYAKRLSWGFSGAAVAAALLLAMFLSLDVFVVDGDGSGNGGTAVMTADKQSTESMPSPGLMEGAGAAGEEQNGFQAPAAAPLPESREADKDASVADATPEMLGALDSGAAAPPQESRPATEDDDPAWLGRWKAQRAGLPSPSAHWRCGQSPATWLALIRVTCR